VCSVTTLAYRYHGCDCDYGPEDLTQPPNDEDPMTTAEHRQIKAHHGFQQPPDSLVRSNEQTGEIYQHCSIAAISPIQVSAPEAAYGLEQAHTMPVSRGISRLASFPGGPHESLQMQLVLQQKQHIPEQQYQQRCQQQQSSGSMMLPQGQHTITRKCIKCMLRVLATVFFVLLQ
jgi:hypothetical protein